MDVTSRQEGLSQIEAKKRLQQYGYNEIVENPIAEFFENAFRILKDPQGLMLLALSFVYWLAGNHQDSLILLTAYIPVAGVDVLLELRSRKALRSLQKSIQKNCLVIRDGKTQKIPTRDLVPGDLFILEEGQTLPADGQLLESEHLSMDESSITGESLPIEKKVSDSVLSGARVLTGRGIVQIEKTGFASEIGAIAQVLKSFEGETSPLHRFIQKVVKIAFLGALAVGVFVFLMGYFQGQNFSDNLISTLTLTMAAIPEEFPIVFTLYLSLAAYRLSKKGILVKNLTCVEGLGQVDVICTDKTGTLTEGQFQLEKFISLKGVELNPTEEILQHALFACEIKAVDAMESSIFHWVEKQRSTNFIESLHASWDLKIDYPFDAHSRTMSHIWENKKTHHKIIAMKGSLEGVLSSCQLSEDEQRRILKMSDEEASQGKRILALAAKEGVFSEDRAANEKDLQFLGLLSFSDPIRPGVKEAIQYCIRQGIQVKMLTGDHLLTAHSIADGIGLPHEPNQLFIGKEIETMSAEGQQRAYETGAVFARLKPIQKLELVEALKKTNAKVAMVGDGVNDAPALKRADVAISMGERATDVARSTAGLVLLKSDFNGIVQAAIEGRRVLAALGQSFGYLIAFHLPIVLIALYQSIFTSHPFLIPIHIILLELLVHPVSAFVFDETRSPQMHQSSSSLLMTRKSFIFSVVRGLILTFIVISMYKFYPGTLQEKQSHGLLLLILGNIGLLIGEKGGLSWLIRIGLHQIKVGVAFVGIILLSLFLVYVPPIGSLFKISPLPFVSLAEMIVVGFLLGLISQIHHPPSRK
ncbi:MAG: haloacid dehalogenase [Oligoflexia bacterium]|nr:MAG: haloacid dehalogenase [Oligoflexia bacterium]